MAPAVISSSSTPTFAVNAVSSSEAASLHGQKAKTPVIAGSVIGGLMGIAWIIGFTIYFVKRSRRKKRNRLVAEGKAQPKPKDPKKTEPEEKVIIPPDPAVLAGLRVPGEHAFPQNEKKRHTKSASASGANTPLRTPPINVNGNGDAGRLGHRPIPHPTNDSTLDTGVSDHVVVPAGTAST